MKKEPERYIYDEQESQETTRLISEAYQSGYVDMPDQESSSPAEKAVCTGSFFCMPKCKK